LLAEAAVAKMTAAAAEAAVIERLFLEELK